MTEHPAPDTEDTDDDGSRLSRLIRSGILRGGAGGALPYEPDNDYPDHWRPPPPRHRPTQEN